jgi:3-methylcrotonyl-CoA carboxylase alpha subunit
MFDKILIANRGEIACRVIRTARRLGIRTVAVYSDADAGALHVSQADEAYLIGPPPPRESYLAIERTLSAARASGAQAIHPGYGFLSENAEFAEASAAAGVVFIGPPPDAIRAMGSKAAARALMERAGVPVVPGFHGIEQSVVALEAAAERIGFPVMIKASAGGGGKGMRVAHAAAEMEQAVALARGEAQAAFGDGRLLIERYLARPRHIEVQVFGDTRGEVVSLFERDCSIQRRHQKVVEEAPAPRLSEERRRAICETACAAARAIGYVGAGTVEFIAEGEAFYFMEMNTRLQVEHPVTEAITSEDLVEWQLRVSAGEPLPRSQGAITKNGHAIEVRVYAEDPARDFAPSVGTLRHLRPPIEDTHVRIDTGVREGDVISVHYDPMIAKVIAWGEDRDAAVRHLTRALSGYEVAGVATNLDLLRAIASDPAFREADLDTGFIPRRAEHLLKPPAPASRAVLAAAVHRLLSDERAAARGRTNDADPWSPWNETTAWRLNGSGYQDFTLHEGEVAHALRAHLRDGGTFSLAFPDGMAEVASCAAADQHVVLHLDGTRAALRVLRWGDAITVFDDGVSHTLTFVDPRAPAAAEQAAGGRVTAPMPGRVLEVLVNPGDAVERGAVLVTIEAMKVQMRIVAPADGVVALVRVQAGDLIEDGAELVTFEEPGA